ncbi:MAG: S41 family peptidase [Clostridium sp.]|nr:S41 family peptidase [Clostridium sp.]
MFTKLRLTIRLLIAAALTTTIAGCHDIDEFPATRDGVFDSLWTTLDEHYCFFREKGVDWDSVYVVYKAKSKTAVTTQDFFEVCAEMLDELRDGHTNLSAPFATSYYRKWWSDYPVNYNDRLIEQYYFNFNYRSLGAVNYGILQNNIGYIRYPSFASSLGAGNIDYILQYFNPCDGLIIDVRDNGGGNIDNVSDWVCRFIRERTLAGYISHKTGPGHDDFSEPFPYYIDLPGKGHLSWPKPVVILADRSTFSAANNFVSIMKLLPGVAVVGDVTGGGSGMPFSSELPNGWGVRFSACSVLDARGESTEFGVAPTEGCRVDLDPEAALTGHDTILDFATDWILTRML